jgi:hypothetical protein
MELENALPCVRVSTLSDVAPDATSADVQTRFLEIHFVILFMWSVQ